MVLYKPDCDSNDCELPNEKATPSILAIQVWLVRLHVDELLIEYHTAGASVLGWAGGWQVDSWLEESKKIHSR